MKFHIIDKLTGKRYYFPPTCGETIDGSALIGACDNLSIDPLLQQPLEDWRAPLASEVLQIRTTYIQYDCSMSLNIYTHYQIARIAASGSYWGLQTDGVGCSTCPLFDSSSPCTATECSGNSALFMCIHDPVD